MSHENNASGGDAPLPDDHAPESAYEGRVPPKGVPTGTRSGIRTPPTGTGSGSGDAPPRDANDDVKREGGGSDSERD